MLKNKTAIITGTNRGIGKAILEEFAKNGANIIAHARRETPEFVNLVDKLSKKYNVEIIPVYFDMADIDSMKQAIMQIRKTKKPIDILVNNAGVVSHSTFNMTKVDDVKNLFDINFFAVYNFTQLVLRLMSANKKGNIINISSMSAKGYPTESAYGSTKSALITMTKSLAMEMGSIGIRANCIAPGFIDTEMMDKLDDEIKAKYIDNTGLKKMGTPKDIAQVAVFLGSDMSSYITAQVINVDGGII